MRQLPEIKAVLLEEMDWIVALPEFVWRKLGELAGQTSHQLRHSCIAAGHATIAFFRWRCLLVYEGRPFSICQGDIGRNLRTLAEEPHEPTDPISAKVWHLMKLGWPENELKRGFEGVADIPGTTLIAEQQHCILAALHRCHPDYTKETATARTHVILTHRLLHSKSHDEKKLDRLRDALAKLKRRQPEKTTGRHLYLSDLHAVARGKIWTEHKPKPNDFQIRIMRKHAQFWAEKTETCRRIYETQARMRTAAKRGEISEELEAVRFQIALLEERILEEAQRRGNIQLSDATLDAHALGLFSNLLKSSRFQDEAVAS